MKLERFPRKIAVAFMCLVFGVALSACTTGNVGGGSSVSQSKYLIVHDQILASQVDLVRVDHEMMENGLIRAYVTLRSNRYRALHLQYRFSWYDELGVEIDAQAQPYRKIRLQGKDAVSVQSVAPNPRASEFKVRLRRQ
jgi:uncharacterized protein YcfL